MIAAPGQRPCNALGVGGNTVNTYDIQIGGMTCDHCTQTVSAALGGIAGVRSVTVDLPAGRAVVQIGNDASGISPLLAAVRDAGFQVSGFRQVPDDAVGS